MSMPNFEYGGEPQPLPPRLTFDICGREISVNLNFLFLSHLCSMVEQDDLAKAISQIAKMPVTLSGQKKILESMFLNRERTEFEKIGDDTWVSNVLDSPGCMKHCAAIAHAYQLAFMWRNDDEYFKNFVSKNKSGIEKSLIIGERGREVVKKES